MTCGAIAVRLHDILKLRSTLFKRVAASDRLIALQENLPDGDPRILFGGMSGGPIFSLPEDGGYARRSDG
jgi:hypothetical protein